MTNYQLARLFELRKDVGDRISDLREMNQDHELLDLGGKRFIERYGSLPEESAYDRVLRETETMKEYKKDLDEAIEEERSLGKSPRTRRFFRPVTASGFRL